MCDFQALAARVKRLRKNCSARRKFTSAAKVSKQSTVLSAALKRCATPKPQSDGVFPQPLNSCAFKNRGILHESEAARGGRYFIRVIRRSNTLRWGRSVCGRSRFLPKSFSDHDSKLRARPDWGEFPGGGWCRSEPCIVGRDCEQERSPAGPLAP